MSNKYAFKLILYWKIDISGHSTTVMKKTGILISGDICENTVVY